MAGLRPRYEKGPLTFKATTVANGGNLKAGRIVEPDGTTGKIRNASADSVTHLGLLIGDLTGSDFQNTDTVDAWDNPVVNAHTPPNEGAVAYQGVWDIKTAGPVGFGKLVKCAANGLVVEAGATPVAGSIVGRCVQEGGIASGAKGKIRLGAY